MDYGDLDDYLLVTALSADNAARTEFFRRHGTALRTIARIAGQQGGVDTDTVIVATVARLMACPPHQERADPPLWPVLESIVNEVASDLSRQRKAGNAHDLW